MKAAFYERTGAAAEVLQLGELPDPQPGPGELRVRLRWSGVNPSDVKSRAGLRSKVPAFPRIVPHSDGMGSVDAVGAGVDAKRIGERVWVWNAAWGRAHGTAAQYVVLPERQAVALPEGTPDEAGACLGIPALTALHAVLTAGGVAGQSVLVAGGAGAVGHYALQFARQLGARTLIATVSSEEKAQIARAAGADLTIDYRRENLAERVREATGGRGVDRIIELDIAANGAADLEALRPGGDLVVYGSGRGEFTLPFFPLIAKNLNLRCFIVYHLADADRSRAEAVLAALLERGVLQHRIAQRAPLAQIVQAHELVETGKAIGNVVIELP
ncbi:NADPH:quinone reductase [Piscinibacter sp.]|uniref:NADPH:quinone reductase n=1 Tax=Piscinibacter sp. TaxID=1903157 RepID=UPI0011D8A61E|nr:MAG: NADPH:quinone reductase [Burkholderiaceae bacterium]